MRLFIVALVVLAQCSSRVHGRPVSQRRRDEAVNRTLIIGGAAAEAGDYPYFAHLDSPGCGGTLIAPDIVLTAGHCKLGKLAEYSNIYVGRHSPRKNQDGAQGFTIVQDSRHPDYDDSVCCGIHQSTWFYGVFHDFMLLKLSGQSSTPPIKLNNQPAKPTQGEELHVIGFGDIHPGSAYRAPNRLHEVTVNYMTNRKCTVSSIYPTELIGGSSMCASDYREDACAGDSGGPLIIKGSSDSKDVQVGVVSWGYDCAAHPGVYGRVSNGYSWIRDEVCRMSDVAPDSFDCPKPESVEPPPEAPEEIVFVMPDVFVQESFSEFHRSLVPFGRSCSVASNSPALCCSSLSNKGNIAGEQCAPQKSGGNFKGGLPCEPLSWVQQNDPNAYDAGYCDEIMTGRQLLEEGKSCSSITDRVECCKYRDNRNDGSIYIGQPCVASRQADGFPRGQGVCEPANFVAEFAPGSALDCANIEAILATLIENEVDTITEVAIYVDAADRQDLPRGRSCRTNVDPNVCCAARDARLPRAPDGEYSGQACLPSAEGDRFSSNRLCEPVGWVEDNDQSSYDEDRCQDLLKNRRGSGGSCSSLWSKRSCCNAIDQDGQPCLPAKRRSGFSTGSRCEAAGWVAGNAPNNVFDCSRF